MTDVLMPPPNLPGRIVRVLLVDDDTELGELVREYLAREGFLLAASRVPVLMLTARGDAVDRIVGLELGADDYLSKPFNPRELVARIRAILRRASYDAAAPDSAEPVEERLGIDDVEVDVRRHVVRRSGALVELTAVEFNVLEIFCAPPGRSSAARSWRGARSGEG
jgi:two-component system, OmpR family, phosphate regulon response regulator OmpR